MRDLLRRLHDRSPPLRRLARSWVARGGYPDWPRLLGEDLEAWRQALGAATGPRVLLATSTGGYLPGAGLSSLLAVALALRGARPHVLLCDAALPACLLARHDWHPDPSRLREDGITAGLCSACFAPAARMFAALGVPVHHLGQLLGAEDRRRATEQAQAARLEEIPGIRQDGIEVGEHALAGALRFFARATLDGEPDGEFTLRAYLEAALLTAAATRRLLATHDFANVTLHDGIYVPQGVVAATARVRGVPVVTWNAAYRRGTFVFSHGGTYHRTLRSEPAAEWERLPWTETMEEDLMTYLASRREGSNDWIVFHRPPEESADRALAELGVDRTRPLIGMLTNVAWDAQVHYPQRAFPDMVTWVLRTIEHFAARPELQLLVRVHPGEAQIRIRSRQPVIDEVERAFPALPRNIFLVAPERRVSTYDLMEACDSVLIYGTKTGVELVARGIPVIVAGEAWIRGKGLTLDASTSAEYIALLDRLPLGARLPLEQVRRARRYAHHFFFRRMIPLAGLEPVSGAALFRIASRGLRPFAPGADPGLDTICRGILDRTPFVHGGVDG